MIYYLFLFYHGLDKITPKEYYRTNKISRLVALILIDGLQTMKVFIVSHKPIMNHGSEIQILDYKRFLEGSKIEICLLDVALSVLPMIDFAVSEKGIVEDGPYQLPQNLTKETRRHTQHCCAGHAQATKIGPRNAHFDPLRASGYC